MNKKVRGLLGALSATTLILSSSLPGMGAEAPKSDKGKPAVQDKATEMACGASMGGMQKPKAAQGACAGMKDPKGPKGTEGKCGAMESKGKEGKCGPPAGPADQKKK